MDRHPLKSLCVTPHKRKDENIGKNYDNLINQLEVYVYDFIMMSQCVTKQELQGISRQVLHAVHYIFPPPQITGHTGEDPISLKKLKDGDGLWDYRKIILGWIFDGIERSIQLPIEKLSLIHI